MKQVDRENRKKEIAEKIATQLSEKEGKKLIKGLFKSISSIQTGLINNDIGKNLGKIVGGAVDAVTGGVLLLRNNLNEFAGVDNIKLHKNRKSTTKYIKEELENNPNQILSRFVKYNIDFVINNIEQKLDNIGDKEELISKFAKLNNGVKWGIDEIKMELRRNTHETLDKLAKLDIKFGIADIEQELEKDRKDMIARFQKLNVKFTNEAIIEAGKHNDPYQPNPLIMNIFKTFSKVLSYKEAQDIVLDPKKHGKRNLAILLEEIFGLIKIDPFPLPIQTEMVKIFDRIGYKNMEDLIVIPGLASLALDFLAEPGADLKYFIAQREQLLLVIKSLKEYINNPNHNVRKDNGSRTANEVLTDLIAGFAEIAVKEIPLFGVVGEQSQKDIISFAKSIVEEAFKDSNLLDALIYELEENGLMDEIANIKSLEDINITKLGAGVIAKFKDPLAKIISNAFANNKYNNNMPKLLEDIAEKLFFSKNPQYRGKVDFDYKQICNVMKDERRVRSLLLATEDILAKKYVSAVGRILFGAGMLGQVLKMAFSYLLALLHDVFISIFRDPILNAEKAAIKQILADKYSVLSASGVDISLSQDLPDNMEELFVDFLKEIQDAPLAKVEVLKSISNNGTISVNSLVLNQTMFRGLNIIDSKIKGRNICFNNCIVRDAIMATNTNLVLKSTQFVNIELENATDNTLHLGHLHTDFSSLVSLLRQNCNVHVEQLHLLNPGRVNYDLIKGTFQNLQIGDKAFTDFEECKNHIQMLIESRNKEALNQNK